MTKRNMDALKQINLAPLLTEASVVAHLQDFLTNSRRSKYDRRSEAERENDTLTSFAVEQGIVNALNAAGFKASLSEDKSHDIDIELRDGLVLPIEVKVIVRSDNGATVSRTKFEDIYAPIDTVCMVYDARGRDTAKFLGWADEGDWRPSKFAGSGDYLFVNQLNRDFSFLP